MNERSSHRLCRPEPEASPPCSRAARDTSHLCFSNFLEDERASSQKISLPFPLPQDLIFLVLEMEATDLYMLECLSLLENVKLKSMLLLD